MSLASVIRNLRVNLSLNAAALSEGTKDAMKRFQNFGNKMSTIAAGIGTGIAGAFAGFTAATDRMRELDQAARKAGLAAKEMQILGLASEQFGMTTEQLGDGLKDFSDKMGDFIRNGSGPMKDFFEGIGKGLVSVDDFKGKNAHEQMQLYVDTLQKAGATHEDIAFYMEGMVNDGTLIWDMYKDGGKAIDAVRAKAEQMGISLDATAMQSALAARNNLAMVRAAMTMQLDQVIAKMAPALESLATALVPVIGTVSDAFIVLIGYLEQAVNWFTALDPKTQQYVATAALIAAGLAPIAAGAGILVSALGPLASAFGLVTTAIRVMSVALLTNPIGLTIAAIAGTAALIYANWDSVGPWFASLWDGIKTYFQGFIDFFRGVFTGDVGLAVEGLKGIFEGFKAIWQTIWDGISGILQSAWDNVIKPVLDHFGATDDVIAAWTGLKDTVFGFFDGIVGKIDAAMTKLKDLWNWLTKSKDAANQVSDQAIANGQYSSSGPSYTQSILGGDAKAGLAIGTGGAAAQGQADGAAYADGVRGALDIRSPSRVMMEIGQHIMAGLGIGIDSNRSQVDQTTTSIRDDIKSTFSDGLTDIINKSRTFKEVLIDALNQISNRLAQMAADGLFNMVFGGGGIGVSGNDALSKVIAAIPGFIKLPGFANGVRDFAGGLAIVGENGPELASLGKGSSVYSNAETKRMLSGSGQVPSIHISMDEGLKAELLNTAARQSAQITQSGIKDFSRNGLPSKLKSFQRDQRAHG